MFMLRIRSVQSYLRIVAFFGLVLHAVDAGGQDGPDAAHGTGLVLDTPQDLRDSPISPKFRGFLPRRVDLSGLMPPPGNQGAQGSCTAWAVGYAARGYYAARLENRSLRNPANVPSPAYIYRAIKSGNSCNEGTSISKALELLRDGGAPSLQRYPYRVNVCESIWRENGSLDFKIDGFNWINPTNQTTDQFFDQIKGELAQNNPVVVSMRVTDAFDRLRAGQIYRYPTICSRSDARDGNCYHAMTVVGYDDELQAFKLINSWGTDWADRGFGLVSYSAFQSEVRMAYVLRIDPPAPLSTPPTCNISLQPSSITEGQEASLIFKSTNADSGAIDHGVGAVTTSGLRTVAPTETTTYVGTFQGPGGIGVCRAILNVVPRPQPKPIISAFRSSVSQIILGQKAALSWSVADATTVTLDGREVSRVSELEVNPRVTTTYVLKAANVGGSVEAGVTIAVSGAPDVALPAERCGKIRTSHQSDRRVVTGFVGTVSDLQWLQSNASDAEISVDVRPWPQCEALVTLENALAQGQANALRVEIKKPAGRPLKENDALIIEIITPPYPVYLHVAYLQADGSVVNLTKLKDDMRAPRPPRTKVTFGVGGESGRFEIGPPFGAEMLIVLAAREPVFADGRPETETDREFLTAIRHVETDRHRGNEIVANYEAIVTASE